MPRTTLLALVLIPLGVSCSQTHSRYPAPEAKDIGRGPREEYVEPAVPPPPARPPVAVQPASPPPPVTTAPPPPISSTRPPISTPGQPETVSPPSTPETPVTVSEAPGLFSFLDGFAAAVVGKVDTTAQPAVVVLPAFTRNPHFHRYEVTRLGDELAQYLLRRLERGLSGTALVVSPGQFQREIESTNRTLADLDTPSAALLLAARTGTRYVVRGLVEDSESEIAVSYELVDVLDASELAQVARTFSARDAAGRELYSRHKSSTGEPFLSDYRIGLLAPAVKPNLRAELQWTIGQSVRRLLEESGAALGGKRVAVPSTLVPKSLYFAKYQQAFRREIRREKERYLQGGLSELEALGRGPIKILGQRFDTLGDAERHATNVEVQRDLSSTGEFAAAFSRILFEQLESQGEALRVDVIPHDDLIAIQDQFSREEVEKIKDGILDAKTKEFFRMKGAEGIVLSELLESGDTYEFVCRIRRLADLKPMTAKVRFPLEPRFAYELRSLLGG